MPHLEIDVDDRGVATLTIDHPPINLMTLDVFLELLQASGELASDDAVRAVVLRSANPEWFIAHFDVEAILQFPTDQPPPTEIGPLEFTATDVIGGENPPSPSLRRVTKSVPSVIARSVYPSPSQSPAASSGME